MNEYGLGSRFLYLLKNFRAQIHPGPSDQCSRASGNPSEVAPHKFRGAPTPPRSPVPFSWSPAWDVGALQYPSREGREGAFQGLYRTSRTSAWDRRYPSRHATKISKIRWHEALHVLRKRPQNPSCLTQRSQGCRRSASPHQKRLLGHFTLSCWSWYRSPPHAKHAWEREGDDTVQQPNFVSSREAVVHGQY